MGIFDNTEEKRQNRTLLVLEILLDGLIETENEWEQMVIENEGEDGALDRFSLNLDSQTEMVEQEIHDIKYDMEILRSQ